MRGTTNGSVRGSSYDRRARKAWLVKTFASNIPRCCRCYRCGVLLTDDEGIRPWVDAQPITVDRIVPGCRGGKYVRGNIRPACADCNSETGGSVRGVR